MIKLNYFQMIHLIEENENAIIAKTFAAKNITTRSALVNISNQMQTKSTKHKVGFILCYFIMLILCNLLY